MKNVHITLVGGQPAPIFNCIYATKPDEVVFICSNSSDSIKTYNAVKNEINIPSHIIKISTTDPIEISAYAQSLLEKYKDEKIYLNISSGLKSWSHLFGVTFQNAPNADVIYMDQNNVIWNYSTMQGKSDFEFDMHTHFRLYGNSIEGNYTTFESYSDADNQALEKIETVRRFNYGDFRRLLATLTDEYQNKLKSQQFGKFSLTNGSYVEWDKGDSDDTLPFVRIHLKNKKGNDCKEVKFESQHAIDLAFNSGWFEYKVAKYLSKWEKANEICLNCKFPYRENIDKNEVDIIINTGSKVLFVECKTQIAKSVDIDKFRSVIKTYGGMGSKGIFITDEKMSDIAKEKCRNHNILTFSLKEEHLGMNMEDALAMLLDSDLYNINTR